MWPISSYHHLEDGQAGGAQPLLCQIDQKLQVDVGLLQLLRQMSDLSEEEEEGQPHGGLDGGEQEGEKGK